MGAERGVVLPPENGGAAAEDGVRLRYPDGGGGGIWACEGKAEVAAEGV